MANVPTAEALKQAREARALAKTTYDSVAAKLRNRRMERGKRTARRWKPKTKLGCRPNAGGPTYRQIGR